MQFVHSVAPAPLMDPGAQSSHDPPKPLGFGRKYSPAPQMPQSARTVEAWNGVLLGNGHSWHVFVVARSAALYVP